MSNKTNMMRHLIWLTIGILLNSNLPQRISVGKSPGIAIQIFSYG